MVEMKRFVIIDIFSIILYVPDLYNISRMHQEDIVNKLNLVEELVKKADLTKSEVRKVVDERIEAVGKRLRWIEDLRKLQGEVESLKARIEEMEKSGAKTTKRKPTKA